MNRVFISYSRNDYDEVQSLITSMKELAPTVDFWLDIDGIEGGDEFDDKIMAAIDSSLCVIFALSDNSLNSKWAKDEVTYARNTGKRTVPVLLNGAKLRDWALFKLGRVDCIDSTDVIQIKKLVKNISRWIEKDTTDGDPLSLVKEELIKQPLTDSIVLKNRDFTVKGVSFTMVAVKGGTFKMGIPPGEIVPDVYNDSSPCHEVTLSDYYIGETLVTQELFVAVMGYNTTHFVDRLQIADSMGIKYKKKKGELYNDTGKPASDLSHPVDSVSYIECVEFIKRLNQLTGENFKLPTEAQWEYAARGGKSSKGFAYSGSSDVSEVAWFNGNSDNSTKPVKSRKPNEIGIFDMTGNVCEWCSDFYAPYSPEPVVNPKVETGTVKILRGGSWLSPESNCCVFVRFGAPQGFKDATYGFRLVI